MAVLRLSSPLIVVAISLVLLLNIIISTRASGTPSIAKEEDGAGDEKKLIDTTNWSDIWSSLHADGLDFDTVFERLTELKALFDSYLVPAKLTVYKNLINDLWKIREPDVKLCEDGLITNIGRFIEKPRSRSDYKYARHYGLPLLEACTDLIVKDTNKAIEEMEQLPELYYGNNVFSLKRHVKRAMDSARKKRYLEMNYVREYVEGINRLLDEREKQAQEEKKRYILYQEHVIRPCKRWLQATDRLRRLYSFLIHFKIRLLLKSHIEYADMCDYIMATKQALEKHLFLLA